MAQSGVVCFEEAIGAVRHAELLFSTSLLAVVGAGDTPALSPRRLCILSTATRAPIAEVLCAAPVVAVRLSRERLVLLLERRAIAHDLATLNIVDEVDTAPNAAGLCALASSASRERPYLAVPAQSAPGAVTVRSLGATVRGAAAARASCPLEGVPNVRELRGGGASRAQPSTVCEVAAHSSAIAALALTPDGTLLATASVKGTVIRVHSLPRATPLCSLRRGARPARVFCLAFSAASGGAPPLLAASCDSGTVHLFQLSPAAARGAAAAAAVAVVASLVPRSLQPALRGAAAPRAAVAVKLPSRGVRTEVAVRPLLAPDSDAQSANSARLLVASCDGILQEYHITVCALHQSCGGAPRRSVSSVAR